MPIRIAIVEDNKEILHNLQLMFGYYDQLQTVASFANAEDFVAAFNDLAVDVVVMDINLPKMSGIEAVSILKPKNEKINFLMCTIYEDDDNVFNALCAGASGYLLKNTPPEKFLQAITETHQGGSPMSPSIARKVVTAFQNRSKPSANYANLSEREKEILDLLAKGFRYKDIAQQLYISLETVRTHVRNIYDKLHVNSRTEAINKVHAR